MTNKYKNLISILIIFVFSFNLNAAEKKIPLIETNWSFKGIFGKFDRGELRRGYQVYTEVCASCHSMSQLSYRNLYEKGGPEFSIEIVKKIASSFDVKDGPNSEGEMFFRPGRLSDRFVNPYENVQASMAANGGAYPPDMSVLAKARQGGAAYIYSLLQGYEEAPAGINIDEGVYYNKYMPGNKIKMAEPIIDGLVEYSDGTEATKAQMAKDVTAFLVWASEPHLEAQHKMGFKSIIYLIILITLVYMSKQRVWSRFGSKVEEEEKEETFDKVEKLVTKYEGEDPKTFK